MVRAAIFVDGSNFFHGAARILSAGASRTQSLPIQYDFGAFSGWLANNRKIVGKSYYVGLIRRDPKNPNHKVEKMVRDQQRLFAWLQAPAQGFTVIRGHIMKHPNQTYHEKGVDVRLAVDLVEGAFEDRYDVAILLSSDTDLIPALQRVRKYKKSVEYIGFADRPSYGLQRFSNLTRLLTGEEVSRYMPQSLFQ